MTKIYYLGPKGTFSESAARKAVKDAEYIPCRTIKEIFDSVSGQGKLGIVPFENTLAGAVGRTQDLLFEREVPVSGEIFLKIEHCLITSPGKSREGAGKIYSHPVAAEQCAKFLENSGLSVIHTSSTAGAVKRAKEENEAAIGSKISAEIYGMKILEENIQDENGNFTRFLVLGEAPGKENSPKKTSLVFLTKHIPGALYSALGAFSGKGINLTYIQSRPLKKRPGQYSFFIDFEGELEEEKVSECLEELKKYTTLLKILGSYPAAETPWR